MAGSYGSADGYPPAEIGRRRHRPIPARQARPQWERLGTVMDDEHCYLAVQSRDSRSDGVVDREGVGGLAHRLGYSDRHLNRQLTAEVGAGPLALARAQRAQTARVLLETTDLAMSQVAFAAGFASIRQFNDTVREVFA